MVLRMGWALLLYGRHTGATLPWRNWPAYCTQIALQAAAKLAQVKCTTQALSRIRTLSVNKAVAVNHDCHSPLLR